MWTCCKNFKVFYKYGSHFSSYSKVLHSGKCEIRREIPMPEKQMCDKNNNIRHMFKVWWRVCISVYMEKMKLTSNVKIGLWVIWMLGKETEFCGMMGLSCDGFKFGEEKHFLFGSWFFSCANDQINIGQINRRKTNLITYIQESHRNMRPKDKLVSWGSYAILR